MRRFKLGLVGLIAGAATILLTSCGGGLGGLGGGGGAGLSGSCSGDFGASGAARKLNAFVSSTNKFSAAADDLANGLTNACKDMGRELGLSDADMAASGDTPEVKAACDAVSAKLRSELSEFRASASLTITVQAQPPVCEVSMNATADCYAECEVDVDPGSVEMECEGGEIRGSCSAECTGSCAVQASGSCDATCEGTCSGGCTGTCNGACDGECSATGPDGQCQGSCSGTCEGTCDAGCSGGCEGQCVAEASASCEGECRGGCSVEFEEPRCTGEVRAPSASADCQASCEAKLEAEAECRPGNVSVVIEGDVSEDLTDRVGRVRNAIESGLPAILGMKAKLERLASSGQAMVEAAADLPSAVGDLGMEAAACASAVGSAIPAATAKVSVSVEVSASVSGSATAG